MYNIYIFIFIFIITLLIIYKLTTKRKLFEYFTENNVKWSPDLIKRFNIYQTTMNNNINQFNLEQLQKQVSPDEAEQYLKTGYWNWSDDLKQLYINKVFENPIIKIDPYYALNYAMKLYNQTAVTELLAWNTKEGHFLLYGTNNRTPENMHNTIKCSTDGNLEKKLYLGTNLWNGYNNIKTSVVNPENIPTEIAGFSFVKDKCNPCAALSGDFTCPFKLNIEGDDSISDPWKKIWNLN